MSVVQVLKRYPGWRLSIPDARNHKQHQRGGCNHPSNVTSLCLFVSSRTTETRCLRRAYLKMTYLIPNVQILGERISSCGTRTIVGYEMHIVEVFEIERGCHRDGMVVAAILSPNRQLEGLGLDVVVVVVDGYREQHFTRSSPVAVDGR